MLIGEIWGINFVYVKILRSFFLICKIYFSPTRKTTHKRDLEQFTYLFE